MSQLLGSTAGQNGVGIPCCPDDNRQMPPWMLDLDPFIAVRIAAGWDLFMGFETPWWPRGANLDASGDEWCQAVSRDTPELIDPTGGGTNSRFAVQGVTRDVWGAPLAGVLVKLFRTSDDLKVDQIVSDSFGNYLVSTPYYPDAHYLVTYKSGYPDAFGSSVNTLIAA